MRSLERSSAFKKDYKRAKKTPRHRQDIDELLSAVLTLLVNDKPLPEVFLDHPLGGNWKGYRDCHLKPDLLLIYTMENPDTLRLARLGTHSDIFE